MIAVSITAPPVSPDGADVRERVGRQLGEAVGRVEREALAHPVLEPAEHLLDRVPEQRELERGARGAVASGPPAVHDHGVPAGMRSAASAAIPAPGQVDRARHVALRPRRVAARVDEHEPRRGIGERGGDVRDIRLEAQAAAEVRDASACVATCWKSAEAAGAVVSVMTSASHRGPGRCP